MLQVPGVPAAGGGEQEEEAAGREEREQRTGGEGHQLGVWGAVHWLLWSLRPAWGKGRGLGRPCLPSGEGSAELCPGTS